MSAAPRIAAVQMNSAADVEANLRRAGELLRQAHDAGAGVAVLPENFAFMGEREADKLRVAEAPGAGPIQDFLAGQARALGLWVVAGTVPLKVPGDPARVFAACLVFDAGGRAVARYDKMHLFDVAFGGSEREERYRESASIAPGEESGVVVQTPAGRIGLSVCYDLRFPELYRGLVAAGAELLAVPSAFTEHTGEAHWDPLLRARAIENQCYVVAPDQCGTHPAGRRTWGHSRVLDPWGRVLAGQDGGEGVVIAEVPPEPLRKLRESFPVLNHRRL